MYRVCIATRPTSSAVSRLSFSVQTFKPRRVGLLTASAVRPPAKDAVLAEPSCPTKSRRGNPRLANDATPNPETRRLLSTVFLL